MSSFPHPRRVVTGHSESGVAIVKINEEIIPKETRNRTHIKAGTIWVTDSVPVKDNSEDVDGGTRVPSRDFGLVAPGGTNCNFTDLAPGTMSSWHRTSSIDHNILIYGKLILKLDNGSETLLENPGDVVVQRGTMHAWYNPGPGWARWVCVLIDADPVNSNGKVLEAEHE